MHDTSNDFAAEATLIAREAGQFLRQSLGRVSIELKAVADLVTTADRESEALIVRRLRSRFPGHGVVAEEGGMAHSANGGYCWYVDPLDGTNNFAHQLPRFAVSLGLYRGDEPVAGVVYDPMLDEMFSATRGGGAQLNGQPIHVSATVTLAEALFATGFSPRKRRGNPNNLFYHAVSLQSQGVRRHGCAALDLCYVAAGRLDAFWEFHLQAWDVAAGRLIVEEAGGQLTDMLGEPGGLEAPEILASNGRLHMNLLAIFNDLFAGRTPALPSPPEYLRMRAVSATLTAAAGGDAG